MTNIKNNLIPLSKQNWEYCWFGSSKCLYCKHFYIGFKKDQNKFIKEDDGRLKTITCDFYRNGVPEDILLNTVFTKDTVKNEKCAHFDVYLFDGFDARMYHAYETFKAYNSGEFSVPSFALESAHSFIEENAEKILNTKEYREKWFNLFKSVGVDIKAKD